MKRMSMLVGFLALISFGGSASASDIDVQQGAEAKLKPVEAGKMKSTEVKPMRTGCYTNVRDCAGLAHFDTGSINKCCSVYFNNGANGQSNFCMPPNQSHDIHVRYNDTFACVGGNSAPPNNAQRNYIWVR